MTFLKKVSFKEEFLRALSGSGGVHLFGTVMAFLVGIQLARGLGVAGYGLYGSALAAIGLSSTIAVGGLQLHSTREIASCLARDKLGEAARLVKWSVRTLLLLSGAAAFAVGVYVLWGQGASLKLAIAAMALTVVMSLLALTGAIVRGSGALVLGQALSIAIRPAAQSCLLFISVIYFGSLSPFSAVTIACISALVAMPAGFAIIRRLWNGGNTHSVSCADEKRIWRRSASKMGLTTAIRAAEAALPLIIIGAWATLEQAGLYRVAASAMVLPNITGTMISIMVPAIVVRLYEEGELVRLRRLSAVSCLVMVVPTMLLALVLWIFGRWLIGIAFGTAFETAWPSLAILTAGTTIASLGGISTALLHAARKEGVVTGAFGISLLISAGGSLWGAPQFGATGVAIAVFLGVLVRTVWLAYASQRIVGIDPSLLGAIKLYKPVTSKDDA